jgi:diaminohydroxyphosphoribosylaminopyrimidine deaminase/5-amino-6-(5-phosphoribosylamino)uracil reductase
MYTEVDHQLMSRALALAQRALYHATPNPRVGCVIARDGRVLGEGWTQPPGSNHAEVEALLDARRNGHDLHGATAYVTLEPCSHFGRTPPCATALIEARIARVIAGSRCCAPTASMCAAACCATRRSKPTSVSSRG